MINNRFESREEWEAYLLQHDRLVEQRNEILKPIQIALREANRAVKEHEEILAKALEASRQFGYRGYFKEFESIHSTEIEFHYVDCDGYDSYGCCQPEALWGETEEMRRIREQEERQAAAAELQRQREEVLARLTPEERFILTGKRDPVVDLKA